MYFIFLSLILILKANPSYIIVLFIFAFSEHEQCVVYSVGDSFMESLIIYVKIFTYALGHPEKFFQQTYIIKTPINDKPKE